MENELRDLLKAHGQEHVLQWWNDLSEEEKQTLANEIRQLEMEQEQRMEAFNKKVELLMKEAESARRLMTAI